MERDNTPDSTGHRPIRIVAEATAPDPRDEKLRQLDVALAAFLAELDDDERAA